MNQDLRKRIIPAILYVTVIAVCTLLGVLPSIVLMQIFAIVCLFEFISNQVSADQKEIRGRYIVGVIILGAILINFVHHPGIWHALLLFCGVVFIVNAMNIILRTQSFFNSKNILLNAFVYCALPFLLIVKNLMNNQDYPLILLGVFILLWLNDAGAYFVGRAFGKKKIHPKVSPGKSWEGWFGGLLIGIGASYVVEMYIDVLTLQDWIVISIICAVMGLIGDLIESSWKRHLGLKDSGNTMGGHGGFLDRLDSFIYSIPFVILYLTFVA